MFITNNHGFIQRNKILILYLFSLIICACDKSYDSSPATEVANQSTHSVRFGVTQTPPSWLTHIAEHNGYFKKQGLDVVYTNFPSGKRALNGMFQGKVDVAVTAETPIVFNSLLRQDFSIIAKIGISSNDNLIVASKDRGIKIPSDLKGKKVATQRASAAHFYLHLFLLKHKLTENDISLSFMKVENLPQALAVGEIDAIATREPFFSEAMTKLGATATVFETPGLYLKSFQLVASNTYIKDNPEILYKLLNALLLAEKYVRDNKEQAIAIFESKFGLNNDRVTTILKYLDLSVTLDQSLILRLEDEAKWAIKDGLTDAKKVPNYLNFIHTEALNKAKPELMTIVK